MSVSDHENLRFGQDPADSELLLRSWNETRPTTSEADWHSFWERTARAAAHDGPSRPFSRAAEYLRPALAASLLIAVTFAGLRTIDRSNSDFGRSGISIADASGSGVDSAVVEPSVSIDIGENDSLAVIRVGYEECPMPNPCVESIETYSPAGSDNTALASNFQLLNEFESIATE